jgi:hypothetical protein
VNAQPSLFDDLTARARRSDPPTSHAAARSVKDLRASQYAVLRCFYECGPMHDEMLLARYTGPPQSDSGLRTRRHELERLGLLQDSGKTATTRSRRATVIWETTPEGQRLARGAP